MSCQFSETAVNREEGEGQVRMSVEQPQGMTVITRFLPPKGFSRKQAENRSFAEYLRKLPLFPIEKQVVLYDGKLKVNQDAQAAVIRMDVGKRDLQQCADAVMRLRAEYLFKVQRYNDIHFNFTNGFNAKYSTWRNGKGISVNGNRVRWVNSSSSNSTYKSFRQYLNKVFTFAGTASLEKELVNKKLDDIEIGDVFIQGGHPGHAVLVVDVAQNTAGDKVFMLAQSYMPAQEIHILRNPNNLVMSPWYEVRKINGQIETPEWTFDSNQLRSFK